MWNVHVFTKKIVFSIAEVKNSIQRCKIYLLILLDILYLLLLLLTWFGLKLWNV